MVRRSRSFHAGLPFRRPAPGAAAARRALERRAHQPPSNRCMTPVGLALARHEGDMQGSSWETFGKGRQAWSVAWLPPR